MEVPTRLQGLHEHHNVTFGNWPAGGVSEWIAKVGSPAGGTACREIRIYRTSQRARAERTAPEEGQVSAPATRVYCWALLAFAVSPALPGDEQTPGMQRRAAFWPAPARPSKVQQTPA